MINVQETLASQDFFFRRAIYVLLDSFKAYVGAEEFSGYVERLDAKFDSLPENDINQSRKFFQEMNSMIFESLQDYHEISFEDNLRSSLAQDIYTFKLREPYQERYQRFVEYRGKERFLRSFLHNYNRPLYYEFLNFRTDTPLSRRGELVSPGTVRYIPARYKGSNELKLPQDSSGGYVGTSYRTEYFKELKQLVELEVTFFEGLSEHYDSLQEAFAAFEEDMAEFVRMSYFAFGYQQLKEILSLVVVPVSAIQNEEIRTACEDKGRKVFILPPSPDRMIHLGASVHVFASHDLDDDSSYLIKPVLIQGEVASDTDELKYLGVGQYTQYDNESLRGQYGESPYVINGSIYAKASFEDFVAAYPEQLFSELSESQKILEATGLSEEDLIVEFDSEYKKSIEEFKKRKLYGADTIIEEFISLLSITKPTIEEIEETIIKASENNISVSSNGISMTGNIILNASNNIQPIENSSYQFQPSDVTFATSLFMRKPPHYNPFALFYNPANNNFIAARFTPSSTIETFTTDSADAACRALGLATGVHTVYAYQRRQETRASAIYSVYSYTQDPEEEE